MPNCNTVSAANRLQFFPRLIVLLALATTLLLGIGTAAEASPFHRRASLKTEDNPYFPALSLCDLRSETASPDAIEMAQILGWTKSLARLEELRAKLKNASGDKIPIELREDFRDLRVDIAEAIQQVRLEVDFVQSELAVEIAGNNEMLRAYSDDRDRHVNSTNNWSFRTNGALWAIAEGLSIPTYKSPRYSIPSGTVGIIAGIVPSVFSLVAVRESSGTKHDRAPRQNMLAPIFDYPTTPRLDYPDSVLAYLRAVRLNDPAGKSRLDHLIHRWLVDKNVHTFCDPKCRAQLNLITGSEQEDLTIDLVSDRLTMLQQLSALINQINRPLLELMMVVRGSKHFPSTAS